MTPLSSAAQAVWDAWNDAYEAQGPLEDMSQPIAAALLAAADQVVPEQQEPVPDEDSVVEMQVWACVNQRQRIRHQLLAIYAELNGTTTTTTPTES